MGCVPENIIETKKIIYFPNRNITSFFFPNSLVVSPFFSPFKFHYRVADYLGVHFATSLSWMVIQDVNLLKVKHPVGSLPGGLR